MSLWHLKGNHLHRHGWGDAGANLRATGFIFSGSLASPSN